MSTRSLAGSWPELPLAPWRGTRDALHLWTQVIGKSLLAACAPQNHWWHCALRVSARGLATSAPMLARGRRVDVELDLVEHVLAVRSPDRVVTLPLGPRSVHAFHDAYVDLLRAVGLELPFSTMPAELPDPIPFERDDVPRPYDPAAARRFGQALRHTDAVLRALAAGFVGKQSPVHFFWGSFDLAATRFSGRPAPERPASDPVTREAYSHELVSFGFWPGGVLPSGATVNEPVLYAYAAPAPAGFGSAAVRGEARYDERLGEFILPYEAVRTADDPAGVARTFYQDVYEAAATLGAWDRSALERSPERAAQRRSGSDAASATASEDEPDIHPLHP